MKIKIAAALVAGTAAMTMLAGCPGVIPGTNPNTNPSATPSAFTWNENALLTGKVAYDNKPMEFVDEDYTHKIKLKNAATGNNLATEASLNEGMYFQFVEGLTEGTKYQVNSDYKGVEPTSAGDINMIRQFVTDPIEAKKSANDPMVTIDMKWEMNPTIGFNYAATQSQEVTFKVDPIVNLPADYQLRVVKVDAQGAETSEAHVSAFATTPQFKWTPADKGKYKYHIRFKKKDKTTYSGTDAFFGDSFRIPFEVK